MLMSREYPAYYRNRTLYENNLVNYSLPLCWSHKLAHHVTLNWMMWTRANIISWHLELTRRTSYMRCYCIKLKLYTNNECLSGNKPTMEHWRGRMWHNGAVDTERTITWRTWHKTHETRQRNTRSKGQTHSSDTRLQSWVYPLLYLVFNVINRDHLCDALDVFDGSETAATWYELTVCICLFET